MKGKLSLADITMSSANPPSCIGRKNSKSMPSPTGRKSSRTSIQRMNSSSAMLANSIKEFQELAMPDLALG